jgi:hypothetical protein
MNYNEIKGGHKGGHKNTKLDTTKSVPVLSESALQQKCVMWFKNTFRPIRKLLYMNHNSGRKSMMSATTDVGLGLTKGIPDLFLAIPNDLWHGLYIEMKAIGGKVSPDQTEVMELLSNQGYKCAVIDSFQSFQELILNYLKHTPYASNIIS